MGAGTSKANTALLHTGLRRQARHARGAARGARLRAAGRVRASGWASRSSAPARCSWRGTRSRSREFPAHPRRARARTAASTCASVGVDELYRREPHLGPGARGAIEVPREGLVCPFTTPLAYATEAVLSGCDLRRGTPVESVSRLEDGGFRLTLPGGELTARYLVNAAGLRSDELDRMLGHDGFTITPAARRADRVRQARAPARPAHRPRGPDEGHEGRADRADRVRQRDARPDRRGRRAQGRHGVDARRDSTT